MAAAETWADTDAMQERRLEACLGPAVYDTPKRVSRNFSALDPSTGEQ